LIPLAVSLLQPSEERSILDRLIDTIDEAPPDVQARTLQALGELENGKGSEEKLFAALPDHKLRGALFPRDTWRHWLFTLGAAALYFTFFMVLCIEGSAAPQHLLAVGIFTATVGIVFLLIVQAVALATQNVIIIPRGLIGILFWVVKLIGFSYRAAADPDNGFLLSFLGYTLGVGLCEELCKALPVIVRYHTPREDSWRSAYLWGLASGAGFGLAEGVIYASDFYNGIHGIGIYLVRNISCVALHAIWTGSAAIMIYRKQRWFQEEMTWHDRLSRWVFVVAVPAVLHGLYDTLLKKDMDALALGVAVLSFVYLAFQISRLRSGDDQAANEAMLREYQRRRNAMPAR
jgi:RsiW-degrading membrane proteinase PrsW (M82 family)